MIHPIKKCRACDSVNLECVFELGNQALSGVFRSKNIDDILNQVINSKTLTWSGKRSNYLDYWNSEVESKFCELELDKINSTLGFDN